MITYLLPTVISEYVLHSLQVIKTFTRCIIRSEREADYDEILAGHLVTFMLDHHVEVMKVCDELKGIIENSLAQKHQAKVVVSSLLVLGMPLY